ncbi:MAG: hypothetical protein WKF92_13940 [Pyrinomonadaceae bacterium]
MQYILDLNKNLAAVAKAVRSEDAFGKKIGIFGKLFGCWHKNLTRPFTNDKLSYQACLDCGARRKFDLSSFKVSRAFYFPQSVTFDSNGSNL